MKENIDIMAGVAAACGALLKSLKKRLSNKETIINIIVAGVLAFGIIAGLTMWLPNYIKDFRIVVFITFFMGWISNDFTDTLEKIISDVYDIGIDWLRDKLKTKSKKED